MKTATLSLKQVNVIFDLAHLLVHDENCGSKQALAAATQAIVGNTAQLTPASVIELYDLAVAELRR